MARAPPGCGGCGPAPRTSMGSIRPAPPASPVGIREAEQRGRSAERGSERMLCAPCAAQSRVSGGGASAPRARGARGTRAVGRGCAGCRMRRGPRRVRRVLLAAICFAPGLFNYMLGSRAGAVQARGIDARRTVTRHILTAPRLQQMRPFFATYQLRSNQAACMVGRVDIPTGMYKRQATSPFKPPPSRAVRALRAPPWPPPWPRPWPRPPPPPPLQP